MGAIIRGAKNAFRNTIRTVSVTLILALSIGLALIMLLSYHTVQDRISSVKATTGTTITINPAGVQGFQGGGEPLTEEQVAIAQEAEHVVKAQATLLGRLVVDSDTNLASAIEPGTLGNRVGRQDQRRIQPGSGTMAMVEGGAIPNFSIPITVTGITSIDTLSNSSIKLTEGEGFADDSQENVAIVGQALAEKNSLSLNSTFTAYETEIKVVGIFDAGNQFGNAGVYMPMQTLQKLSDQVGEVSSITVTADSIENVESVQSALTTRLGADNVDVTSNLEAAEQSIAPLENIKKIALSSLIGALVAAAVITLLIMMMIIRERRREIGVLKAIGASNTSVVTQFVTEALVLTGLGSIVGMLVGISFSNPVLNALVTNSTATANNVAEGVVSTNGGPMGPGGGFSRAIQLGGQVGGGIQNAVQDLQTSVGFEILLYGLLAAAGIAIIGSAVPAWLIAKVKPAEVMRSE